VVVCEHPSISVFAVDSKDFLSASPSVTALWLAFRVCDAFLGFAYLSLFPRNFRCSPGVIVKYDRKLAVLWGYSLLILF